MGTGDGRVSAAGSWGSTATRAMSSVKKFRSLGERILGVSDWLARSLRAIVAKSKGTVPACRGIR